MLLHLCVLPRICQGYLLLLFEPGSWQSLLRLLPGPLHESQVESWFCACRKLWTGASSGRRPPSMRCPTWPPS